MFPVMPCQDFDLLGPFRQRISGLWTYLDHLDKHVKDVIHIFILLEILIEHMDVYPVIKMKLKLLVMCIIQKLL